MFNFFRKRPRHSFPLQPALAMEVFKSVVSDTEEAYRQAGITSLDQGEIGAFGFATVHAFAVVLRDQHDNQDDLFREQLLQLMDYVIDRYHEHSLMPREQFKKLCWSRYPYYFDILLTYLGDTEERKSEYAPIRFMNALNPYFVVGEHRQGNPSVGQKLISVLWRNLGRCADYQNKHRVR
jgi:hypothetical protein